jgi:hypothetical protein
VFCDVLLIFEELFEFLNSIGLHRLGTLDNQNFSFGFCLQFRFQTDESDQTANKKAEE